MVGRAYVARTKENVPLVCIRPKVSVLIVTYNHHKWIAQAIESVLAQKVTFAIEVVIGDDFSTDGTRDLIEGYAARYPGVIRLNCQDRRPEGIPGRVNQVTTLEACQGEFIAFLDGDDFWTDPGKLAHQVSVLEARSEIVGVAHDALILHEEGTRDKKTRFFSDLTLEDHGGAIRVSLRDIIVSPPFHTSTWMVRSECLRLLPVWYDKIPAGDWGLFAIAGFRGDMLVEREIRSVYRRHRGSMLAQLTHSRTSERSHWHRKSFQIIADAFPNAERTAKWRRVDARSKLNEAVDQRGLLRAFVQFAVLFGVHDRKRLIGMIWRPRMLAEKVTETLYRLLQARAG